MRRRILLLVVGMTTLVVLAFAVPLVVLIRNNAHDDNVRSAMSEVSDISRYLRSFDVPRTSSQISSYLASLDDGPRRASVMLPDGTILGQQPPGPAGDLPEPPGDGFDPNAPDTQESPAPSHGGPPEAQQKDYHGGLLLSLRVPLFGEEQDYVARVWVDDDALYDGSGTPLLVLVLTSVGLLVLGVVLGELLTRRIVRPLQTTADTAQRIAAGDVAARAPTTGPAEVAEVGAALNRLADRIDELIAEERETVADLSHRLRTPLTALRLDAEALEQPEEAERIGTHVSALERMLTAIIHAARRPQREGRLPSCDATEVVGRRVAFWSALTEDQGRTGTVELPDAPLPVRAGVEDLAAAVDALLENVIAHTPEGTAFAVRLRAVTPGAVLEVSDEGPGLPADEPVRGRSDRGSSGLGLDIARRCAEASGGAMDLGASPSGGARITLRLGPP